MPAAHTFSKYFSSTQPSVVWACLTVIRAWFIEHPARRNIVLPKLHWHNLRDAYAIQVALLRTKWESFQERTEGETAETGAWQQIQRQHVATGTAGQQ